MKSAGSTRNRRAAQAQSPQTVPAAGNSRLTRYSTTAASTQSLPARNEVWPSASRREDFDRAIESYALAAQDVNGKLLPVAAAWLAAWRRDSELALYSPDGLHPSAAGSYLAALVMYGALFERSPVGLPAKVRVASGVERGVTPEAAAVLQAAAAEVLGR